MLEKYHSWWWLEEFTTPCSCFRQFPFCFSLDDFHALVITCEGEWKRTKKNSCWIFGLQFPSNFSTFRQESYQSDMQSFTLKYVLRKLRKCTSHFVWDLALVLPSSIPVGEVGSANPSNVYCGKRSFFLRKSYTKTGVGPVLYCPVMWDVSWLEAVMIIVTSIWDRNI